MILLKKILFLLYKLRQKFKRIMKQKKRKRKKKIDSPFL